jgi:hypothetical protein
MFKTEQTRKQVNVGHADGAMYNAPLGQEHLNFLNLCLGERLKQHLIKPAWEAERCRALEQGRHC